MDFLKHLLFATMLVLFTSNVSAQGADEVRRGIYGAKRQLMREVNRTKRDVRQVDRLFSKKKRVIDPAADTAQVIEWNKTPYIPNSGMIHDYRYVYSFLHASQSYTFEKDPDLRSIEWDSLNNVFYKNIGRGNRLKEHTVVMGWHPYWMAESYKYYPYKMLSIISLYAYDINPNTGGPTNQVVVDSMMQSSILDSAKKYGSSVYLSITSFGAKNNRKFLRDKQSWEIFINEVLSYLNTRKKVFGGIDLNFEEVEKGDQEKFNEFVLAVQSRLSTLGFDVILDVPYYTDSSLIDYRGLSTKVKYINVMGYDFKGEYSETSGSIAPLKALSNEPSLTTAVNDMLVLGVPPQKLILSLPLYAATWDVTRAQFGEPVTFESFLPYYQVQSRYASQYNPFYDPLSSSFYYLIREDERVQACWYENEVSLDIKFSWLQDKGLAGVGLWALGYEQGDSLIWDAVAQNFGQELVKIEPIETELSGPYGLAKAVVDRKEMVGLTLLVLSCFIVFGFVISLFDWRVRDVLFKERSFRVVYSLVFIVLSVAGVQWWWNGNGQWALVVGLLIGSVGVLIISFLFAKYRDFLR